MAAPSDLSLRSAPTVAVAADDPPSPSPALRYRNAVMKTRATTLLLQKTNEALNALAAVATTTMSPELSKDNDSTAQLTPEILARRKLGAACLLLEKISTFSAEALSECSHLLTSTSKKTSTWTRSQNSIIDSDHWRSLKHRISIDLTTDDEAEDDSCSTRPDVDTIAVPSTLKWQAVSYGDEEHDADAVKSPASTSWPLAAEQPHDMPPPSASSSQSPSPSLPSTTSQQQPRQRAKRPPVQSDTSSSYSRAKKSPSSKSTTSINRRHPTTPTDDDDRRMQSLITKLENEREKIEADIRRDHGLPPILSELDSTLGKLEQKFAKSRDRHTFSQLKNTVKTVISRAHQLGEHWGPYFRGRSFALLKIAKRLSNRGVCQYLQELGLEAKLTTVTTSVQYYGFCCQYRAVPWTTLSFSTMVEDGSKLSAHPRFQELMKSLGTVVMEERQEVAGEQVEEDVHRVDEDGQEEARTNDESTEDDEQDEEQDEEESEIVADYFQGFVWPGAVD